MLEFLKHSRTYGRGWDGGWQEYGWGGWGCAEPKQEKDVELHDGRDFSLCGSSGVDRSGGSGVWHLWVGCEFCGSCGGSGIEKFRTGGRVCYEAGLVVLEWERGISCDVWIWCQLKEMCLCGHATLWNGDVSRFFSLFGMCLFGEDSECESGARAGSCGEGCQVGSTQVGGVVGIVVGGVGGVRVLEVVNGMLISVGGGGAGNKGNDVVSDGRSR